MELLRTPEAQIKLSQARRLMNEALDILDEIGETGDVGTHLDLALCRLEKHLGVAAPGTGGAQELRAALERELLTSSALAAELPWELKPI
ncbi:MAG: hypothetical protein ACJ8FS_09105 [Sphingomicrobium sp.]